MLSLDTYLCEECGKVGCVSWSATEGARCFLHSSYIGQRATEATRQSNFQTAKAYQSQLDTGDYPSEDIRIWMRDFITRWTAKGLTHLGVPFS